VYYGALMWNLPAVQPYCRRARTGVADLSICTADLVQAHTIL
jgi:hypothetical protein